MAGKSFSPDQITEAIALREAGYTATAISARLGVSVRTLTRVFEKHGTKKGAVKEEVIAAARKDLIETVTSNERVKHEAARIVADDLAHVSLLRQRIAAAYEHLIPTNLEEAAVCMRATAAAATAIKVTSDTLRHSLRTDKALDAEEEKDLPSLTIIEVTAEEARRMHMNAVDEFGEPDAVAAASTPVELPEENERVSEGEDDVA